MDADPIDIDELVRMARKAMERAENATKGPWVADHEYEMFIGKRHAVEGPRNGALITGIAGPVEWTTSPPKETERSVQQRTHAKANADFIAAARTDVPALAQAVLQMAEMIRHAQDETIRVAAIKNEAIIDLHARIRELESDRDDWCDAARSEAEALNRMTRQKR